MSIVKQDIGLPRYEQDLLYHLNELKYSLETAIKTLEELKRDLFRISHHEAVLKEMTYV